MPQNIEETHWERAAKTRMGKYLTKIEARFVQHCLDFTRLQTIMDIGAEAGRFSQLNLNVQTISIDIDKHSLKRLRNKIPSSHVIQADARHIPIKNETFDAITMIEVLDYIPELQEVFQEAHRTLKTETSLIVSFGNKSSLKARLRQLSGRSYLHSYDKVIEALSETELTVKKKMGYNWLPFGRMSQSFLISPLEKLEHIFGLRKIPSVSPWVLVHAVKPHNNFSRAEK